MVFVRADYTIANSDDLELVKGIVREFMGQVGVNEPNTILYRSFQEKDNPKRFAHMVGFTDEKAEQIHKRSQYNKTFTTKLYPLCEKLPTFIYFDEVAL